MTNADRADAIRRFAASYAPSEDVINIEEMVGGISATMIAFDLETAAGRTPLVARWPGSWITEREAGAFAAEYDTVTRVHAAGIATPEPIHFQPAQPSTPERQFYVVRRLVGRPSFSPNDPVDYAAQCAAQLAKIHDLDLADFGLSETRRLKNPWSLPRAEVDETLREPEIRAALDEFGPQNGDNLEVLRHGDFWPGNLLCEGGSITAIVDWENASLGDPLMDIAITRLDLLWVLGESAMSTFTEAYLRQRPIELRLLPYFDLVASLRHVGELESYTPGYALLGRPDITLDHLVEGHNSFVARALAQG